MFAFALPGEISKHNAC